MVIADEGDAGKNTAVRIYHDFTLNNARGKKANNLLKGLVHTTIISRRLFQDITEQKQAT